MDFDNIEGLTEEQISELYKNTIDKNSNYENLAKTYWKQTCYGGAIYYGCGSEYTAYPLNYTFHWTGTLCGCPSNTSRQYLNPLDKSSTSFAGYCYCSY